MRAIGHWKRLGYFSIQTVTCTKTNFDVLLIYIEDYLYLMNNKT